jgi:hypothetical protein
MIWCNLQDSLRYKGIEEEEDMKEYFETLTSYNIFNNLLPGVLFAIFSEKLTGLSMIQENIVLTLFLCYFVGLCISRIGSLVIEPALKRISFVVFVKYENYLVALEKDPGLERLSEVNNMYRSLLSLSLILCFLVVFKVVLGSIGLSKDALVRVLPILFIIIFAWSYRKQTQYINTRAKRINNDK